MDDLCKMNALRPLRDIKIPLGVDVVNTPLRWSEWERELVNHPDQRFASFIVEGIRQGFRVGFDYSVKYVGDRFPPNMHSASSHPEPIDQYVKEELQAGRLLRVPRGTTGIHVSRFGVIPKPHRPGTWRLITDLSSPRGQSVNDGVAPSLCSVSYASVDDAVRCIMSLGPGALLAKFDIASAYRTVPVHPADRLLLGMRWRGDLLVDGALPFGLRSAPKLFTAVADALMWVMGRHGIVHAMHYLDDFLILGPPKSESCRRNLSISLELCERLGFPIASHKLEGPSSSLSFLGIQVDTVAGSLSLPPDKIARLSALIKGWQGRKCCRKRELLSLIGQLQHACRVVRPGRTFLRRMIDLLSSVKGMDHWARLNAGFRSDLLWWDLFLESWNGVALCRSLITRAGETSITSDASGRWGCGAFTSKGDWFQLRWPPEWEGVHITAKELLIVIGCGIWGHEWKGETVRSLCDNAAVVAIIRSGSSRDKLAMHLMRCLFFFTARHQIVLVSSHIPGKLNTAADHLSRDGLSSFLQLVPGAKPHPSPLPQELVEALVLQQPDWTSKNWRSALHSIFHTD